MTDEELAVAVTKSYLWKQRQKRGELKTHYELAETVKKCLRQYRWIQPEDFLRRLSAVVTIIQKNRTAKAVATRRRNTKRKRRERELARQGELFD